MAEKPRKGLLQLLRFENVASTAKNVHILATEVRSEKPGMQIFKTANRIYTTYYIW